MYATFGSRRRMGFLCCTCLLAVLFHFPVILALTDSEDADALIALSNSWKNKLSGWTGSDPCGSNQWVGISCTNSRITSIILSSLGLEGTISGAIGSLTELQTLDLSFNGGLTGILPPSIRNLKKLTNLNLAGCNFYGEIPDLGNLQQLISLSLNSNNFSGGIPPSIGRLSKLIVLDLGENKLTGTIPVSSQNSSGLDMLKHTQHFHFGKNQFSGTIPDKLFSSDMELIHVLFDNNNFSGNIPSTLGLVKPLLVVRLDRNLLTGPVPSNINNLTSVEGLQLSNNKLSGPLPNLTGMDNLSTVDLSNNSFEPSDVPPWFSTLWSLTTLVMENLRIGNSVPQALFTLPQLETVRLKDNWLNGTLDLGGNLSNQLQLVDLQNNKIDHVVAGGYKNELILVGNPFCEHTEQSDNHCTNQQQSAPPYSISRPNCQQTYCSSDQKLSSNCKCAYPYMGILNFRAPSFSDPWNNQKYKDLEESLLESFQSCYAPVDSVVLLDAVMDSHNYFQVGLQVFPSGMARFNQSGVSAVGFILGSQIFQPPSNFGSFFFIGQAYPAAEEMTHSKSKNIPVIIGASVGGFTLVLAIIVLVAHGIWQRRKVERIVERCQPFASWDKTKGSVDAPQLTGPRSFSFDELKKITNNFSEANDIGTGGYGKVYRGMLVTGQLVAIKRAQQGSIQGRREFKTEIELLSRVHHKNIVALVGFCFDQGEQMLVYEYAPNGALRDILSGKSGIHLDWRRRLQIALGAARGLTYLHDLADPPIIHRDIKSSNILLDHHLNAKVADFGLCKPLSFGQEDRIISQVKGTMGYLDPEYCMTQQLTEKSDVYSFGVLLLELITARRPLEKGMYIVREVTASIDRTKYLYGLHELLDPSIGLDTPLSGFEKFVDLAMRCVEESGVDRPAMSQVVKEIEGVMLFAGINPNAESSQTSASYEGMSTDRPLDSSDCSAGASSSKAA